MKTFLIVWAVWTFFDAGGPSMTITEVENVEICNIIATAVRSSDGWEGPEIYDSAGKKYAVRPDAIRTKCVQTGTR